MRKIALLLGSLILTCAALAAPAPKFTELPFFDPRRDRPIDPDGDCKVTVGRDCVTMEVPGTAHTLDLQEWSTSNAPRLLRPIQGDFVLTVRLRSKVQLSEGSARGVLATHVAAGLLVEVGDRCRTSVRFVYGAFQEDEGPCTRPGLVTSQLKEPELSSGYTSGNYGLWPFPHAGEVLFRLQRKGNNLIGQLTDGEHSWDYTYEYNKEANLPRTLRVGVIATSTSRLRFAVTFDRFKLMTGNADRLQPLPR